MIKTGTILLVQQILQDIIVEVHGQTLMIVEVLLLVHSVVTMTLENLPFQTLVLVLIYLHLVTTSILLLVTLVVLIQNILKELLIFMATLVELVWHHHRWQEFLHVLLVEKKDLHKMMLENI